MSTERNEGKRRGFVQRESSEGSCGTLCNTASTYSSSDNRIHMYIFTWYTFFSFLSLSGIFCRAMGSGWVFLFYLYVYFFLLYICNISSTYIYNVYLNAIRYLPCNQMAKDGFIQDSELWSDMTFTYSFTLLHCYFALCFWKYCIRTDCFILIGNCHFEISSWVRKCGF